MIYTYLVVIKYQISSPHIAPCLGPESTQYRIVSVFRNMLGILLPKQQTHPFGVTGWGSLQYCFL